MTAATARAPAVFIRARRERKGRLPSKATPQGLPSFGGRTWELQRVYLGAGIPGNSSTAWAAAPMHRPAAGHACCREGCCREAGKREGRLGGPVGPVSVEPESAHTMDGWCCDGAGELVELCEVGLLRDREARDCVARCLLGGPLGLLAEITVLGPPTRRPAQTHRSRFVRRAAVSSTHPTHRGPLRTTHARVPPPSAYGGE